MFQHKLSDFLRLLFLSRFFQTPCILDARHFWLAVSFLIGADTGGGNLGF